MDIIYTPDGSDEPIRIPWKPGQIKSAEMEVIERATDMTFREWTLAVEAGSALALHALLWVHLGRANKSLEWSQVDFVMDEITWGLDAEGKAAVRDGLAQREDDLDDEERKLLEELRSEIGPGVLPPVTADPDADDEGAAQGPDPKAAASPSSAPSTSGPSPTT